ncbi:uncharacterized protein LOC133359587 isoform X2 [Lethenteron reissneri]|uniref:uncharacterized protein LOC133359587 isoform X2 n=1 Tax=Lethenteron reissneri TaxID=7753 RepID=UPI002AB73BB6|nr:uncharacterized protein LOC133359587 isoform X2 [Lethenteron reissneri]
MDESMAAKLIKGKRPELKTWIGRDPTYLLDYLDSRDLISRDKYHGARDMTVKVERANFLIDEFIDRDECLKLWRALESLQDHYPQLKEWISDCASTTHHACDASGSAGRPLDRKPSASESDADQRESQTSMQPDGPDGGKRGAATPGGHRLNNPQDGEVRDMDEAMAAKLIKGKRPQLKKWIGRDPTYLLDYLDSKDLISRDKYHGACDITVKVERANFLIDEFIDRDECLKLWRALESLQDNYPQLKEWISDYGKSRNYNQPDSTALDQDEQQITQIDSKQNTQVPVITDEGLLQIHEMLRVNIIILNYPHVMRLAGLAEFFIVESKENHGQNVNERNYAMLRQWRESLGREATYGRLAEALDKAGFTGLARKVMAL